MAVGISETAMFEASRNHFRQTKIENLGVPSVSHEYVGGLDVSVDDSFGVSGVERISDFDAEIQQCLHLHGAARNAVLQRGAHPDTPWR